MLLKKFIDREEELKFLQEKYEKEGFEFVIVYGRRRIGKTTLLRKFIEGKKGIYILCENKPLKQNFLSISEKLKKESNLPIRIDNIKDLFMFLITYWKNNNSKKIIIMDEFSYLIKESEGEIIGELQTIIDEILKDKNLMLILSGSSISMMERNFLKYDSPIYGRTTGVIHLKSLRFLDVKKWFNKTTLEDVVKIYGAVDGVPRYLEFFEGRNVESEIKNNFFNRNAFLFREGYELLNEELRSPSTYFSILESISQGKNTVSEIANYVMLNPSDISSYLNNLKRLGIITRITPITQKKIKKTKYIFEDKYFYFWFLFVSPYYEEIDSGFKESAEINFNKKFNTYLGKVFEDIAKQLLLEFKPINITRIGKWWHKDKEIDVVAVNEETKDMLAVEVKWQDLELKDVKCIIDELHEKLEYVNWKNDRRKETLGIFAKKVEKKAKEWLLSQGYKVWDLGDVEKAIG